MCKVTLKGTEDFNSTYCIQWGLIVIKRPYECGDIIVLGYSHHCSNLEKLAPSVLISIDLPVFLFSKFRTFNYYSIMWSMNFFCPMAVEILENNSMENIFLKT